MKKIIDCTTGEVFERELNKAEKDQQKVDEAAIKLAKAEAEAKAAEKEAILNRLGLTADELQTILG
jgi:stage III sporulation protein SpoIIIAA